VRLVFVKTSVPQSLVQELALRRDSS
jgi:hypothetical protein